MPMNCPGSSTSAKCESPVSTAANVVIANGNANWAAGRSKLRQAQDLLRRKGLAFASFATEGPGHARELATAAAAQAAETIVVIGGDGTVHETINGLVASGQDHLPRIGIVPAGSSNDLAKSLGIAQNLHQACDAIVSGRVRDIDVGCAGPHCFCMASTLGYFADIAAESRRMKGLRGSTRYVMAALSVIRRMTAGWQMHVTADGRTFHGEYAVLLVGNAPRFGGLTMLPGARLDDGVLDCLLIEMASKREALQLIPLVYRNALERHPKATRFQATSLSIRLDRPARLCNDGEVYASPVTEMDYAVLPKQLQVLC